MLFKLFRIQLWLLPGYLGLSSLVLFLNGIDTLSGSGFEAFGAVLLMIPLVFVTGIAYWPVHLFQHHQWFFSWWVYILIQVSLFLTLLYYRPNLVDNINTTLSGEFVWFVGFLGLIYLPMSLLGIINALSVIGDLRKLRELSATK